MDRIHEKANKFMNEVRKKKIILGNINTRKDKKNREKNDVCNVSDVTHNSCMFCEKVFISSNYLMKHVYRRHSENLIKLHKRCMLLNSDNSSDLKNLFTFLEEEFFILKNELSTVKQTIGHKIPKNEVKKKLGDFDEIGGSVHHMNRSCVDSDIGVAEIDSREIDLLKEKIHNIESNIQCLHNKFEELKSVLKTEVLFKQDIHKHKVLNEENFLRDQESQLVKLKVILLKEIKSTFLKELNENNLQWKSKFAELKHDILRLDHVIAGLKKQIDSPDYLAAVEKRLEQHIVNFLGTSKRKTVKRRNSRIRNRLSISKNHNLSRNDKMFEIDNCDNQVINKPKSVLKHNQDSNKSYISPEELSCLIAEKLSYFNISNTNSKLSSAEYEEKLKLINSVKDSLTMKYSNFSDIYKSINTCANHKVHSKLSSKKNRKLRFAEPSGEDMSCYLRSNKADFFNETHSVVVKNEQLGSECTKVVPCVVKSSILENQRLVMPGSEGFVFPDVGGGGESSGNFPDICQNFNKGTFLHTSSKECKTSSPIVDIHSSGKADCSNKKDSFIKFPITSDAYEKADCASVEIKNTSDHMLDNCEKHDSTFLKPFKIYDNADLDDKSSELDDFDKNSLESLSSWEEEENLYVKDGLH